MLTEMIEVSRAEYDRLRKAACWHERREERLMQTFRGIRNRLVEHNRALAEENVRLREAVLQSYIAARRVLNGYEGEVSIPIYGTIGIVEKELSRAVPGVKDAWEGWAKRHPLENELEGDDD